MNNPHASSATEPPAIMNTRRALAATLVPTLVVLGSCGDDGHGAAHSHSNVQGAELRLDNGKKWKANEATHLGMDNVQKLLTDFEATPDKNHPALGESLRAETNVIIQECTMTGEPHQQLHLVLNPMLEIIEKLVSGNGGDAEVRALRAHVKDYRSHFEL